MTDGEQKLKSRLRGKQLEYYFRRQTPIGKYIVDFVCWKEKLVVEIDGSQHFTNAGKEHDRIRDQFLKEQGFRILHFDSVEVLNNTDDIIEAIYENLKNPLFKKVTCIRTCYDKPPAPYEEDSFKEVPNCRHR
jgi:very-short-patch-repair endonuclease